MLKVQATLKTLQEAPNRDVADPAAVEREARAAHDQAVVDAIVNLHERVKGLEKVMLELDRRIAVFDDPTRRPPAPYASPDQMPPQTSAPIPELPVTITTATAEEMEKLGLQPGPALEPGSVGVDTGTEPNNN